MIDLLKKLKELFYKKYRVLKDVIGNTLVYFVYYNIPIDENLVYVESHSGTALNGNLLRICQELNKKEYREYKLIIRATQSSKDNIETLLRNYSIDNAKIVVRTIFSLFYMERAKYIFLDAGVQGKYVKKEGQVFINTWHGTPFKVMGKKNFAERHSLGNLQRMFLMCDYFLFPNEYMKNIFIRDYMVENLWKGKCLLSGYPRNSIFFDLNRRTQLKHDLGFDDKEVYAYLPTHRGTVFNMKNREQGENVQKFLDEIDQRLTDKQVLMIKFHLYNNQTIDCSRYKHIINFPEGYETYDILNIVDCLITDYSSVFFDFANTRKKIILFAYDEKEYFLDRGVYFPFNELPFPKVKNIDELVNELNSRTSYDYGKFIEKYCKYDSREATTNLCKHIIKKEKVCCEIDAPYNGKENVLIYAGNLAKNGITSSLLNLLKTIDLSKRNYVLTFMRSSVKTAEKTLLIPDNIPYIVINADPSFTFREKLSFNRLLRLGKVKYKLSDSLKRLYCREIKKQFWNVDFTNVLNFDGYTKHSILMFSQFDCKKTIWAHNDMINEIATRNNQSYAMLSYLYNTYDNVAAVSEGIVYSVESISGRNDNLKVVHNCFDYNGVLEKGEKDIMFDKDTSCVTANVDGINGVLGNGNYKFISIGRFSTEKNHIRLLNAFDKFNKICPKSELIIIGGHGNKYNETLRHRNKLDSWKNITIIKSISNPMPILKRCDLFLLSSEYEGLPVVFFEAGCFNIPCVSTNINGVRSFMREHNGMLVDVSEKGLFEAMLLFHNVGIDDMKIDFYKFNEECVKEFEALFC